MNCNPNPEATCGTLLNDTCVVFTGPWPECFSQEDSCHRQSEFNSEAGIMLCEHDAMLTQLYSSLEGTGTALVTGLKNCDNTDKADKTIQENFQEVYDQICDINIDLNLPIPEGTLEIPACIENPCDPLPFTLKTLLQAILDQICECHCP